MKIMIVADWHGKGIYADALYNEFERLGNEVIRFSWKEYFKHYQYPDSYEINKSIFKSIYYRIQNKYTFGPVINKINNDLICSVKNNKPDLIFIYRGTHIYPKTINKIKEINNKIVVFGYNNDDPFSEEYKSYFWRHYIKCTFYYDHIFVYRNKNIQDYKRIGYEKTSILRSYYTKDRNYIIKNTEKKYDVIFIGHFEDDSRDYYILSLFEKGYNVKIFGTGWDKSKIFNILSEKNGPIVPVYDNYNKTLNETKIALVFLSKLNRDTYTRRCFEIPAAGALMLSEYTEDLNGLFKLGVDADYFNDANELVEKVTYYLNNEDKLKSVANSGYLKLTQNGHEVSDRVKEIIKKAKKVVC